MFVSFFGSVYDTNPQLVDWPWEVFVQWVQSRGHLIVACPSHLEESVKLSQPGFSPTRFSGNRNNANAVDINFGVIDLDEISSVDFAQILNNVRSANLATLVYTSWGHSEHKIKVRLVFPFNRPVHASEWRNFWPRMNQHVALGFADTSCKSLDRAYRLPSCPDSRKQFASIWYFPGQVLNVDLVFQTPGNSHNSAHVKAELPYETLVHTWKQIKKKQPEIGDALEKILNGEAWATQGNRDNILFQLTSALARSLRGYSAAAIATHFQRSCSHFDDISVETVKYKLERAISELEEKAEDAERQIITSRRLLIQSAIGRESPYTVYEFQSFADWAGCTTEEFSRRWIIQRGSSYYCFVGLPTPRYLGPFSKDEIRLVAHVLLSPAIALGLKMDELSATGENKQRPIADIVDDYGSIAEKIIASMVNQVSYYHAESRTLVEAPCPFRPLVPQFDQEIDTWLRIFAGDRYHYLYQWLSWLTRIDLPCSALYLDGPPGCGKSLLAKGISRIWTVNGPTTLAQALGTFNQSLMYCPIIFADEATPKDLQGRARTAEIRELIQIESQPLRRKNLPDSTLHGCGRLVIAANNLSLLEGEEGKLTANDVQAIVERFTHIKVNFSSRTYLEQVDTRDWVSGDRIAQHVLWIIANTPKAEHPPRFLVTAPAGELHQALSTTTYSGAIVAHWLAAFLLEPNRLRQGRPIGSSAYLVRANAGKFYAVSRAITENWMVYPTNIPEHKATIRTVSAGLRALAVSEHKKNLAVPGFQGLQKLYEIRLADIVQWAESSAFCQEDQLLAAFHALCLADGA